MLALRYFDGVLVMLIILFKYMKVFVLLLLILLLFSLTKFLCTQADYGRRKIPEVLTETVNSILHLDEFFTLFLGLANTGCVC